MITASIHATECAFHFDAEKAYPASVTSAKHDYSGIRDCAISQTDNYFVQNPRSFFTKLLGGRKRSVEYRNGSSLNNRKQVNISTFETSLPCSSSLYTRKKLHMDDESAAAVFHSFNLSLDLLVNFTRINVCFIYQIGTYEVSSL